MPGGEQPKAAGWQTKAGTPLLLNHYSTSAQTKSDSIRAHRAAAMPLFYLFEPLLQCAHQLEEGAAVVFVLGAELAAKDPSESLARP